MWCDTEPGKDAPDRSMDLHASANTETTAPVPPPSLVGPAGVRVPRRLFLPAPSLPLPLYLVMTRVCCCPAWELLGTTEGAGGGAGADGGGGVVATGMVRGAGAEVLMDLLWS